MDVVLSIMVLAAIALALGALYLWRRAGARKQAVLMAVLAAVMIANVLIWTLPGPTGQSPADKAAEVEALDE